jgi:hypothetical protein
MLDAGCWMRAIAQERKEGFGRELSRTETCGRWVVGGFDKLSARTAKKKHVRARGGKCLKLGHEIW